MSTRGISPIRHGRVKPGHDGYFFEWRRALAGMTALLMSMLMLAAALPARATGTCSASIGAIAPVPTVAYDPFDGVARSETFAVQFVNNGSADCWLSLAIASQTPGSLRTFAHGGDKLRYLVESTGGSSYSNSITQPRGSFYLQGGVGKTKTIDVRVKVPAGLIAPAGTYNDVLTLRLFRNSGGGAIAMGSDRTAPAAAEVEARAQVNIAGASSSYSTFGVDNIDFNTLTNGETRSAIVQVRATSPVKITVDSQNDGKLKHQILSGDPGVLYSMKLDGTWLNLAGLAVLMRTPPVSLDGASYPMLLQVGDVGGRPAGDYKDLLTISVSPN